MFALTMIMLSPVSSLSDDREAEVRTVIQSFYKAFDEGFTGPADYATEDWNHINPAGGRDHGREATLKTVRAAHQTFLKGATDTVEKVDIRFASSDVAVGTVVSVASPVTTPDGVKHGTERRHPNLCCCEAEQSLEDNAGPEYDHCRTALIIDSTRNSNRFTTFAP
jgi:hypothetical protein